MVPIGAFDQDVGEHGGDQFARSIFVEQRHGIHRGQAKSDGHAIPFGGDGPRGAFQAMNAGIGIERQHQHVAQGPCLFQ